MPDWMLDGHGYGSPPYNESTVDKAYIDFIDIDNPLHDDNRQIFIDLWKFIANRYKSNQYVLFGIMNEPLCQVELNGQQSVHLGITYSELMEQVIDAIRSTGAAQLIFVDRPYVWYFDHINPVNRTNIVWEDHLYISPGCNYSQWESTISNKMIKRYVTDFKKPLYMGEYGFDPFSFYETDSWQTDFAKEVGYLKSHETAGYSYHQWSYLEGEYEDHIYDYLNQTESDYILSIIYG
jgi:aryl-phospho-beta-D-glucosidase BglC (GH1 family)